MEFVGRSTNHGFNLIQSNLLTRHSIVHSTATATATATACSTCKCSPAARCTTVRIATTGSMSIATAAADTTMHVMELIRQSIHTITSHTTSHTSHTSHTTTSHTSTNTTTLLLLIPPHGFRKRGSIGLHGIFKSCRMTPPLIALVGVLGLLIMLLLILMRMMGLPTANTSSSSSSSDSDSGRIRTGLGRF